MDNLRFKFRAWIEEDNEYMFAGSSTGRSVSMSWFWETVYKYGYEVEQYTGLKDKNGKEVFEGDIVRIEDFVNAVVKWREDIACWTLQGYIIGNTWGSSMLEVIGNIHDNPELLEKA